MMSLDQYKGSLLYAALGDSLGWITEFSDNKEKLIKKHGVEEVVILMSWEKNVGGRFYGFKDFVERGSYSDDTQLTLSVYRSIREYGVDQEYFSKIELKNWLLYARGAGVTIKNAARKISRKSATWNNNFFKYTSGKSKLDYKDSGANGAAMRILPIALAYKGDTNKILNNVFANSIITHGHPTALIGAMIYSLAIELNKNESSVDFRPKEFLVELGSQYKNSITNRLYNDNQYDKWLLKWNDGRETNFDNEFKKSFDIGLEGLRFLYTSIDSDASTESVLTHLGCYDNETKGSGIATVLAGIYIYLKHYHDPIECILVAANKLGTDTDSIAAFSGGLVGFSHGESSIPDQYRILQDFNYIAGCAKGCYDISLGHSIDKNFIVNNDGDLNNLDEDSFELYQKISFNPLGEGIIESIDRQDTIVEGKYNLILMVQFDIGQSCVFSKIFNK